MDFCDDTLALNERKPFHLLQIAIRATDHLRVGPGEQTFICCGGQQVL